jgi:DNA methylase
MRCVVCFTDMPHVRASKKFCGAACRQAFHRQHQQLRAQGLSDTPVCHCGRFQDYQDVYAGKIDVLITDPPYDRASLPLYNDLATLARTVLRPGGWLLCLTGWALDLEARQTFSACGLEFLTVGCYHMPSTRTQAKKKTSTGWRFWQEHHKPLLWYQQPGTPKHHRRAGGNDTIQAGVSGSATHQTCREDEQNLPAFQDIVRLYTNPADVILDPMMGWGTTLAAAVSYDRIHVIGIELLPDRYNTACERLGMVPQAGTCS